MKAFQDGQNSALIKVINDQKKLNLFLLLDQLTTKKDELNAQINEMMKQPEKEDRKIISYKIGERTSINNYLESIIKKINLQIQ